METSFVRHCDPAWTCSMRRRSAITLSAMLVCAALVCPSVHAQGAGPGDPSDGHSLNLAGLWFGSYTNNFLGDLARGGAGVPGVGAGDFGLPLRGRHQGVGLYHGLNGNLTYAFARHKGQTAFTMNARTNASYLPDLDFRSLQHSANVTATRPLGRRTSVRFTQTAHISDLYRLQLFPDITSDDPEAVLSLGDEYAVIARKTYASTSMTNLSRQLTSRASFGVSYRFRYVQSPEDEDFDFMSHNGGASFQYQLTRYAGFRASYNYREVPRYAGRSSHNPDQTPFQHHGVSLGIDYNRAFSLSGRRTSLTFTTGSSLVASGRAEIQEEQTLTSNHLRPFLQGSASLRRNLGRTWDAQAGYRRMVLFVEGFSEPIFADGANAGVVGEVSRYLKVNAVIGYSSGTIGRSRTSGGNSYSSTTASAQFAYPIINNLDFFTYYFYIRQLIDRNVVLPVGFPHSLNRHSVRMGLSFRLPVIS